MHIAQFQLLISAVAGWVNRSQQDVIEYLQEENRVLREQLGGRRYRKLLIRWEKKPENYLALMQFAATIIVFRLLG